MFYKSLENDSIICEMCPHFCKLKNNQIGNCSVRQNISGKLYSKVYNHAVALHVDPIEKKPLYHVAPGSKSMSVATIGCNFHCRFCQNSEISQVVDSVDYTRAAKIIEPEKIVSLAKQNSCASIAYTYTEPTIYFEYAYDIAKLAHEQGIINIFVTNGYINPAPLNHISKYLDAANVDLKSFNTHFYKKLVKAELAPVLATLKLMKKLNIWVEVTTLLIPDENDSPEEINQIAKFIKNELGVETPWHISRFYPQYKLSDHSATSIITMEKAHEIAVNYGLKYVYLGNVPGNIADDTYCYKCGKLLIKRYGYQIIENNIIAGKCDNCDVVIDGLQI